MLCYNISFVWGCILLSIDSHGGALLQLQRLGYTTGCGKPLLSDINLDLRPAECLAIIGPNGSGKSTLLRTLTGELTPTSGDLYFDGRPLSQLSRLQRARTIALLAQSDSAHPQLSVSEYVELGRLPYQGRDCAQRHRQLVEHALTETGMRGLRHQRLGRLSGGERQRAALARAFAQTPQLLLLDEPTNHLDPLARASLLNWVKRKGIAAIAVLHDLALVAPFADRVAVIERGRLVRCDIPSRALAADCINPVFGLDSFVIAHPHTGQPLHIFEAPQRAG